MVATRPTLHPAVLLLIGLVSVAVVACGSATKAGPGPGAGIDGVVTLGNLCPPAQQVTTCAASRPYEAQVKVLNASGQQVGDTIRSNAAGHFRVDVAPGTYTLVPLSPRPNVPPVAPRVSVTVAAGRHTVANIRYDTGIA